MNQAAPEGQPSDLTRAPAGGGVRTCAALAAAACPLAIGLAAAVLLGGVVWGWLPLWPKPNLNPAELAAMRDMAGVMRERRLGADMNRAYPVRRGLLPNNRVWATPLEAAIFCRERWVVQIVLDQGARVDDRNRTSLACLARAVQAPEVEALLRGTHPIACPDSETK